MTIESSPHLRPTPSDPTRLARAATTLFCALALSACGGARGPAPQTLASETSGGAEGGAAATPAREAHLGTQEARFSADDVTTETGTHVHVWRLTLDAGQRVAIRMSSSAVDSVMEVRGPDGFVIRNDDAFTESLDAMVELTGRGNTYEITATTYSSGEVGPYALTIAPSAIRGAAFTLGEPVSTTLADHTTTGLQGSWLHFDGQAGSIVRLRVTSPAFDTIAMLTGPGGQVWENDDANDLGPDGTERALDSTIVAALPETGTYQLRVTAYGGSGTGPYAVRSEVRPPVVLGPDGEVPDGLAGPNGGGRVLGLYAGVTEYQTASNLYGCADDARLLAEAMRASNVQTETDQLVLPNGLATREGFLSGIGQLAERAGPNDVVLVFFSGHGQQTADAADGDELDGLDETIVLSDGSLTDDQVVEALSRIQAGTVILALDSCHSGGFADDWVRAPNRVGLFSSDEDVLSDVAQPHQAGGYLAWHLRRGVLGEADRQPRDGVLHAGELTDYLYAGFVADQERMNPQNENDRAQRLVVRRGAVGWDDVLWVVPRARDLTLPPVPDLSLQSTRP